MVSGGQYTLDHFNNKSWEILHEHSGLVHDVAQGGVKRKEHEHPHKRVQKLKIGKKMKMEGTIQKSSQMIEWEWEWRNWKNNSRDRRKMSGLLNKREKRAAWNLAQRKHLMPKWYTHEQGAIVNFTNSIGR